MLLDQLPRDDPEHFIDALPVLRTNLMAAIPNRLLAPKPRRAVTVRTRHQRSRHRQALLLLRTPLSRYLLLRWRDNLRIQLFTHISYTTLKRHLSPPRFAGHYIGLCPHHMQHQIRVTITLQLPQPDPHLLKTLPAGDIIAQNRRVRASIIQPRNRTKPFLPRCIPDLESNQRARFGIVDACGEEGGADGRLRFVGRQEGLFDVAVDEGGLAYALRAEDDEFGFERGGWGGRSGGRHGSCY